MNPEAFHQVLEEAANGSEEAIRQLLGACLEFPFVVPDRFQDEPLKDQPSYPSEVFALLGVLEEGRSIIPAFASVDELNLWAPHLKKHYRVRGQELFTRCPAEWWIVICPGDAVSKEFSPWEIERLKRGKEGIPEVASEILGELPQPSLALHQCSHGDYPKLEQALLSFLPSLPQTQRIFLARQEGELSDGSSLATLLLGVVVETTDEQVIEESRAALQDCVDRAHIGAEPVKIYVGASADALALSLFKDMPPFWEAPRRGFLAKIKRMLR